MSHHHHHDHKKSVGKRKLRNSSTHVTLAPEPRVKVKKKPRGRSFEKGNGFGSETRFKPGESGNLSGRPHCKEISKALRERLESDKPLPARTFAEKLAKKWIDAGLAGNVSAISSASDRVEGRPAVSGMTAEDNPLLALIASMHEAARHRDLPEGFIAVTDGGEADDETSTPAANSEAH